MSDIAALCLCNVAHAGAAFMQVQRLALLSLSYIFEARVERSS